MEPRMNPSDRMFFARFNEDPDFEDYYDGVEDIHIEGFELLSEELEDDELIDDD